MNGWYSIDYEHDKQWEREISLSDYEPEPEKEIDYDFIDRIFERVREME